MKFIKSIIAAFRFLTVLPIPVNTTLAHLENSIGWFPLAGAAVGLITVAVFKFGAVFFPPSLVPALTILAYIILTRGFHLDGFADTIDGFFSGKDRSTILKIMKEPNLGTFAVLGIGTWFLICYGGFPYLYLSDFIIIHTYSRFSILLLPLLFSYPRESGTGKFFVDHVTWKTLLTGFLITALITIGMNFIPASPLRAYYPILALLSVAVALLTGYWSKKKIGGITGDVLGFVIEINHILFIITILFTYKKFNLIPQLGV